MSSQPILFIIPGACSFGSQVTLERLNIAYQVGLTTPEIRASNEFKKINPTGKVGALKDGNETVGENLAILLYLADKYPDTTIAPKIGTIERARTYQWLSYLSSTLHPLFSQNMYPERFIALDQVQAFKDIAYPKLLTSLTYIDQELAKNNGNFINQHLTIVDAQAYGLLRWAKLNNKCENLVDLTFFTQITKFLNKMEQEEVVKNALAIERNQTQNIVNSKFNGYYVF